MSQTAKVRAAMERVAEVLSRRVGTGQPITTSDLAERTHVSGETIRNFRDGRTTPSFAWMLMVMESYRHDQCGMVLEIFNAAVAEFGFRVITESVDPEFLDANKDGRITQADARLHLTQTVSMGAAAINASIMSGTETLVTREEAASQREIGEQHGLHLAAAGKVMRIVSAGK